MASAAPACTTTGGITTCTFSTVGAQTWTVPAGVTTAAFDLLGAQGGVGDTGGGQGGEATATLTVIPGTTFQLNVGGHGTAGAGAAGGAGGFNGGADGGSGGGGGGGGASDVRNGSFGLPDRLLVAGGAGGGGGGSGSGGGGGGGYFGGGGGGASVYKTGGGGGGGGTQTGGGTGGASGGGNGSSGVGGAGAASGAQGGIAGAGGVGGGNTGGDASPAGFGGGGGGGGSGFGPTGVVFHSGVRTGDGQIVITYTTPDTTPPQTSALASPPPNAAGWNNSNVTVTLIATDDLSGVGHTEYELDGAAPQTYIGPVLVVNEAKHVLQYWSVDVAGNVEATNQLPINIDKTMPTVTYSGNAGTYIVDQQVQITCAATDATSGVATSTCQNISGPAYSFGLGTHSYSAAATDKAGNTSSPVSMSFAVSITPSSLQSLINRFCTDPSVAASLDQDAATIAHAPNAGARAGALSGFTQLVQAQTGKSLTSDQAKVLITLAKAL